MLEIKKFFLILDKNDSSNLIVVFFLMLVTVFVELLSISLIYPFLNILIKEDYVIKSNFFSNLVLYLDFTVIEFKFFISIIFFNFFLLKLTYLSLYFWKVNKFAFGIEEKISSKLFISYISRPYNIFASMNSTAYMQNIIKETSSLTFGYILPLMRFFTEFFVAIFLIILLLFLEFKISLVIFFVFISFLFFYFLFIKNYFLKWGNKRMDAETKRIKILKDVFESIKSIKIYSKEFFFLKNFNYFNSEKSKYHSYAETLNSLPILLFEFLIICLLTFFILFLLYFDKKIDNFIPILGLFGAVTFRLVPSFNRILSSLQNIRFTKPILSEISNALSVYKGNDHFYNNVNSNKQDFKSLQIINVNFVYEFSTNKSFGLHNINLYVNQNETVGIVGDSGSGKTTLINLIIGLLTPTSGLIKYNDKNICDNLSNWRSLIGYVSQDIYLLDDTLKKNIAFGIDEENIDENLLKKVIKSANLTMLIDSSNKGVEANVGERGNSLSGRQIQRIGLARALYRNPGMLILDEATSALDLTNENIIIEEINSNIDNCAKIIISHRLSTLKYCDRIYKIEKNNLFQIK
jgi:ABC-type multidrug transport system fused ATPase/permease subunit